MFRTMLESEVHRATVTQADLRGAADQLCAR
jgi:aspartate 1-decarboxylase